MALPDIAAQIEANNTLIALWQAELAADDLKKSYSKDGETLNRNEWRQGLIDGIAKLTQLNAELQRQAIRQAPYRIRTRKI